MDFSLTDEQRAIRDTVRDFVDRELKPREQFLMQSEASGGPAHMSESEERELQLKAKASGLWGIDTPEEYGGVNFDWVTQALVNIELGRTFVHFNFGGTAPEVLYYLNEEQKARYLVPTIAGDRKFCFCLSEPGVGSDAHNISTTAVRDGDDWIINGEKTWITVGNEADYALVFCKTPQEGEGVTAFLVDRDMGWKSSPIRMMGAHDPAAISFEDVRVPNANMFGGIGEGFKYAMRFIHRNRAIILPAREIGASERLLQMATDYAQQRITFGEPLSQRENIRFMIAESEIEIRALKLLTLNAAWQNDAGHDVRHASCVTKYYGAQVANKIVDRVMQIFGGIGYSKELPIERWYRDLRIERIYEGSDEMNLLSISRNLFNGNEKIGNVF